MTENSESASVGQGVDDRPFVVTLVHGTFARKAKWIEDDSQLCKALKNKWGDAVSFERVRWSGGNSHGARLSAASTLADSITRTKAITCAADNFVVAHSHGGNVAFMACHDEGIERQVSGIACLSTPFLFFHPNTMATFSIAMFCLFAAVGSGALVEVLMAGYQEIWKNAFMVLAVFSWIGVLIGALHFEFETPDRDYNLPSIDENKCLIIRSPADEASGLLQLTAFLQWLLLRPASRLLDLSLMLGRFLLETRLGRVLYFGYFVVMISIILISHFWPALGLEWVTEKMYLAFFFGVLLPIFAPMPIAALIAPIRFLLLFPYGWDLPFRAFMQRVTAEASPPGTWSVTMISPGSSTDEHGTELIDRGDSVVEPMLHGEAYDHPQAIEAICDWIEVRRRLGLPPKQGT